MTKIETSSFKRLIGVWKTEGTILNINGNSKLTGTDSYEFIQIASFRQPILSIFISLLIFVISCDDKKPPAIPDREQLALLTYYIGTTPKYEVQLFKDSTFKIPSKHQKTTPSGGTFSQRFSRWYFKTLEGENELCEFYFADSVHNIFRTNKGCGDKQDLKIED